MNRKKKFGVITIVVIVIFSIRFLPLCYAKEISIHNEALQATLAEKIIRFHVIADNDTTDSQQLKLQVKDETLGYLKTLLNGTENLDETRQILQENLSGIEQFAYEVVKREGYEYNVSAELEKCYFPIKEYGDLTFPAGTYEALRIKIGKAEGKNWWCVMYPNLCFVDGTYAVVSDEARKELSHLLTKDEYHMLLDGNKTRISFKYLTFLNRNQK
jgi:stage II sporulation protein R